MSTEPPAARLPGLDGLRALAIVLVLAYHLFPGLAPGGFLGVDIFLVVSGYLITALLVHEHRAHGRIRLRAFWARRARRLLPALAVVVAAVVLVASAMGGDVLVGIGWQLLGVATFSYNWWSIAQGASYLDQTSPELFRHAWSLAVEEQFYLLWPLALIGVLLISARALRVAVPLVLAALSAGALAVLAGDPLLDPASASAAYLSTVTHGFGLLFGAALALALDPLRPASAVAAPHHPRPRVTGALADGGALLAAAGLVALALVLSIDQPATYRGGLVAATLLTGVLIVCLQSPHGRAASIADAGLARWVGERSYGLYLWHWPVIVMLSTAVPAIDRGGLESWWLGLAALVLSIALAAVSYRVIEQPVRRRGWRVIVRRGGERGLSRGAATATASVVAVSLVVGSALAVIRAPEQSEAAALIAAGRAALDAPPPAVPLRLPMIERNPAGTTTAALPTGDRITAVGDSVMLAAAPQLQAQFPGIAIDAAVSRQMWHATDIVAALASSGDLRDFVVLGLGTNGSIDPQTLHDVRALIGPERALVLVNPQAPKPWIPAVSDHLIAFASDYRNVVLADWRTAIAPQLDVLARDQVHPGPIGARIYTSTIASALQYLVDLPEPIDYEANPELFRPR